MSSGIHRSTLCEQVFIVVSLSLASDGPGTEAAAMASDGPATVTGTPVSEEPDTWPPPTATWLAGEISLLSRMQALRIVYGRYFPTKFSSFTELMK